MASTATKPNIWMLPRTLFDEISAEFCAGEERNIVTSWRYEHYLIREIDPVKAGAKGAIGFREWLDYTYFAIWSIVPEGTSTISEPEPAIEVVAGPQNAGIWGYGHGNKMREVAHLRLPKQVNLLSPGLPFVARVLQRAHELALTHQYEEYWESDRHPDGDYTKPDQYE